MVTFECDLVGQSDKSYKLNIKGEGVHILPKSQIVLRETNEVSDREYEVDIPMWLCEDRFS